MELDTYPKYFVLELSLYNYKFEYFRVFLQLVHRNPTLLLSNQLFTTSVLLKLNKYPGKQVRKKNQKYAYIRVSSSMKELRLEPADQISASFLFKFVALFYIILLGLFHFLEPIAMMLLMA